MGFITLHSSIGDSRPLYINTDYIIAVHHAFGYYDQTVIYVAGVHNTGEKNSLSYEDPDEIDDGFYEVNESPEDVMDLIEEALC